MPESMCISCYHSDIVGIGNVLMDPYQISELEIGLFNLVDV
jgi:hypothetical protein